MTKKTARKSGLEEVAVQYSAHSSVVIEVWFYASTFE